MNTVGWTIGRGLLAAALGTAMATAFAGTLTYSKGQGLIADGFGGYDLQTELCGVQNGADADGPYILWVFTGSSATSATITTPADGTQPMTRTSNGAWKFVGQWSSPSGLPGHVSVTYTGNAKNAQLTLSHGCRPFSNKPAWCSPGFWKNARAGAWGLVGFTGSELFNQTVSPGMYGGSFTSDPTISTVLSTNNGTYKGSPVAGTDPRAQGSNAMNAFNATGAYLTDHIPGYAFDPAFVGMDDSDTCPIDNFGNFKN